MVQPTRWQYFVAQGWIPRIWVSLHVVAGGVCAYRAADPSIEMMGELGPLLATLGMVGVGLILGFFLSLLTAWPVLGPFYAGLESRYGPYAVGDSVQILVGPHRGRNVRVYDVWASRRQLRVELDDAAREQVTDVFWFEQVLRVDAEAPEGEGEGVRE